MKQRFLKYKWYLLLCVIICIIFGYKVYKFNKYEYSITVPGKIIASSCEYTSHYKSTKINTDYYLCIRPDNQKYKPYAVKVDFLTVSIHSVGDHIAFKVLRSDVDPDYPKPNYNIYFIFLLSFVISIFILLTLVLIIIIEP